MLPPLAVNVVLPELHISRFPETDGVFEAGFTTTVIDAQVGLHWLLLKLLTK